MSKRRACLDCGKPTDGSRCPGCRSERDRLAAAKRKAWGQARPSVSPAHRRRILDRDGWRCHLCGKRIANARDAHIDHVIPRAAGGPDHDGNLKAAHRWCNQRKGAKRA